MSDLASVHSLGLIGILISAPLVYMLISYAYLAWWHGKPYLLNTIVHENGRLTLLGSVFYFDHYVAHVPMIVAFGWCAVGGVALTARVPRGVHLAFGAGLAAVILLGAATVLVVLSFLASLFTVGWQRTIDYVMQRIERDGVMSKGGLWNQLQLSNVPIALGTIGLGSALRTVNSESPALGDPRLFAGGIACIGAAAAVLVVMNIATWPTWRAFLNPRWLAHSMRELATWPLTGIPTALGSVVLVQYLLFGPSVWTLRPGGPSLVLVGLSGLMVGLEFALVRSVDILAIAQKPSFAAQRMSITYLLASHVFEHALDFVFIALFAGGTYAMLCWAALSHP
jgi:hypothetical protein